MEDITLETQEESRLKKALKKLFKAFIAIFLLFLFISVFIFGYNVLKILEGMIISSNLNEEFIAEFDGSKVIFKPEVYNELKGLYLSNQETEIKVCLEGHKEKNNYYITGLYIPQTFEKSVFEVVSSQCNNNTIISFHTHQYKHCIFSEQDLISYREFRKLNPDGIMGLMCETKKFNFYKEK